MYFFEKLHIFKKYLRIFFKCMFFVSLVDEALIRNHLSINKKIFLSSPIFVKTQM